MAEKRFWTQPFEVRRNRKGNNLNANISQFLTALRRRTQSPSAQWPAWTSRLFSSFFYTCKNLTTPSFAKFIPNFLHCARQRPLWLVSQADLTKTEWLSQKKATVRAECTSQKWLAAHAQPALRTEQRACLTPPNPLFSCAFFRGKTIGNTRWMRPMENSYQIQLIVV